MLHTTPRSNYDLNDYLAIEKQFNCFLIYLAAMVCPQKCQIQFEGDFFRYRTKWKNHNKGSLVRIFADGPQVERDAIKRWARDPYHGLLHGIITAFFAMIRRHPNGIPEELFLEQTSKKINTPITFDEKFIVTCLVHDFEKSCFGREPHDVLLRESFFSLVESAYNHSAPIKVDELVVADRWELMRFFDYEEWVDANLLDFNSKEQRKQIVCFQHHLRPALTQMFIGLDDIWLRHSPEKEWITDFSILGRESIYPPLGFWRARQDDDFYAIEIGTMPPRACLLHGYAKNNSIDDNDPASYSPYGMISLTEAKNHFVKNDLQLISPCLRVEKDQTLGKRNPYDERNEIWPTDRHLGDDWQEIIKKTGYANSVFISRDHLCMQGKIPLKKWIFIYDDNRFCSQDDLVKRGKDKLERDWPTLFKNSAGFVNLHIATNLIELSKQIESILVCVRA